MIEGVVAPLPLFGVHLAFACGNYIRMALFPETPKEESQKCPRLDSPDFGSS
jgi:hypothetical protein